MFTTGAAELSEPVGFLCLGCGLPGCWLLIWKRYCWIVCRQEWPTVKIVKGAKWLFTFFIFLPFPPPHVHVSFFSLGTKLLMLQFRWCPKLKILLSLTFSFTFTPSLYLPALGTLCFLFKRGYSSQRGLRREALIWDFRGLPSYISPDLLVSCCFADDI